MKNEYGILYAVPVEGRCVPGDEISLSIVFTSESGSRFTVEVEDAQVSSVSSGQVNITMDSYAADMITRTQQDLRNGIFKVQLKS